MARIVPLFSGSKGNCYYIGTAAEGVLIDAQRSTACPYTRAKAP